jgi:hypothetical protein
MTPAADTLHSAGVTRCVPRQEHNQIWKQEDSRFKTIEKSVYAIRR